MFNTANISNLDDFQLQRTQVNWGYATIAVGITFLITRWGWALLTPLAIVVLVASNNQAQDQGFSLLAFAFFGYLLSFAIKPILARIATRYKAICVELEQRNLNATF